MASAAPTPSTLRSWEEAFTHPLPIVRKLETQLRTNISDNQNKLRSLVGASYRDLLGTAERIIDMDAQMEMVEGNLAQTGRRCDYRVVQKGRENLGGLGKAGKHEGERRRLEVVARVQLMKGALEAVSRCVRKNGDALVGAKVLVFARLMHKSVSEQKDAPPVVLDLGRKLAGLRKKLLAYIERSLVKSSADRAGLLNTLCAYVMITSSAPKDALRHFLQVRCERLETKAESSNEETVLEMLEIYSRTLLSARDLFPRRFADVLSQLAKTPLLQDQQVLSVPELNIDIYGRWIPEDIRTFTPWVRHDQLSASDASDGLKAWARQAQKCLLSGIEGSLHAQEDVGAVLGIRQSVMTKYLAVSSKLPSDRLTDSVDKIRDVFLACLGKLAGQAADVSQFALTSLDETADSSSTTKPKSPWDLAAQPLDLSGGALSFRAAVVNTRQGRDGLVQKEHDALDCWLAQLNVHWEFVAKMRAARWDDDVECDIDDLDYEGHHSLRDALSKDDPARLEQRLRGATAEALEAAYGKVQESGRDAAFRIRILRELDQRRRFLGERLGNLQLEESPLVSSLHKIIAESASEQPTHEFKTSLQKRVVKGTTLWEGTSPLPVQPSPSTFKLLVSLQRSMAAMGEDLWSPDAVNALKTLIGRELSSSLTAVSAPQEAVKIETSGGNDDGTDHDSTDHDKADADRASNGSPDDREARLQRLFDAQYLSRILTTTSAPSEEVLRSAVDQLSSTLNLDDAARQRLNKGAQEYWRKTYLLFGLLAAAQ